MYYKLEPDIAIVPPDEELGTDSVEVQTWIYFVLWYYQHVYVEDIGNCAEIDDGRWLCQSPDPVALAMSNAHAHAGIVLVQSEYPHYVPNEDDMEISMTLSWGDEYDR